MAKDDVIEIGPKAKNFIVTCHPDATGRAATPACALHSRLPFADAKKVGIVCAQPLQI